MTTWDKLAADVREARIELTEANEKSALAKQAAIEAEKFLIEAEACFRAAKGALIEFALGKLPKQGPQ
jgi:hypothetical protein